MMTFQQLSTLIKQGYTEDQIKQLNAIFSPDHDQTPAPTPDPAPSPAPAPDNPQTQPAPGASPQSPTPTPATESQPQPQPQQRPESETQKMLREMLGLMRNGAINSIQQPTQQPVTAESILAKVLEP